MPSEPLPRVVSVTVAFNPDRARLAEQLRALQGQVDEILVLDNASEQRVEEALDGLLEEHHGTPLKFITLDRNEGVARGFNIGARHASGSGARFVLLLDDDSVPAPDMVARLLEGYRQGVALAGASAVAAVGPRVNDPRDPREYPFIRLGWFHNRRLRCGGTRGVVSCDFLISSGSLVALDAVQRVGEFDEALFIDSVDLEWCCRARSRDFALYGVCAASLDHRLGDRRRVFLGFIQLVVHSPVRIYYMTRNRFLLYRRPYMPLKWKLKDFIRAAAKFTATMLFVAPRLEYAHMTLRAIRDAAMRRGGELGGNGADLRPARR
jgi:rhamnosyltransferase